MLLPKVHIARLFDDAEMVASGKLFCAAAAASLHVYDITRLNHADYVDERMAIQSFDPIRPSTPRLSVADQPLAQVISSLVNSVITWRLPGLHVYIAVYRIDVQ